MTTKSRYKFTIEFSLCHYCIHHLASPNQSFKMVRLITHNMLTCHVSKSGHPFQLPFTHLCTPRLTFYPNLRLENCTKDNYPLVFQDAAVEIRPAEPNLGFIERFLPKLEWSALVSTAKALGDDSLPEVMPEDKEELRSEEFLTKLHHVLMEVSILSLCGEREVC